MGQITIIAKNQTAGEIIIDDLGGIRVPASGQETLTDANSISDIYRSVDLVTEINANNILLNDGTNDLTKAASLQFVSEQSNEWQPPFIDLGSAFGSGAAALLNPGVGLQWSFDAVSDDEIVFNVDLVNNGVAYDGSDLKLKIHWQIFSTAPGAGDTVLWEVDYAFVKSDGTDNPGTIVDGNLTDSIVVDAMTASRQYTNDLSTMTGKSGAKTLQITLRRNSSGGGADDYPNAADIFGIELIKA